MVAPTIRKSFEKGGAARARETGRGVDDSSNQMLYGIAKASSDACRRGQSRRVYVPLGTQWYGYFVRRLAERPGQSDVLHIRGWTNDDTVVCDETAHRS